jgi:hypothetical protein
MIENKPRLIEGGSFRQIGGALISERDEGGRSRALICEEAAVIWDRLDMVGIGIEVTQVTPSAIEERIGEIKGWATHYRPRAGEVLQWFQRRQCEEVTSALEGRGVELKKAKVIAERACLGLARKPIARRNGVRTEVVVKRWIEETIDGLVREEKVGNNFYHSLGTSG